MTWSGGAASGSSLMAAKMSRAMDRAISLRLPRTMRRNLGPTASHFYNFESSPRRQGENLTSRNSRSS